MPLDVTGRIEALFTVDFCQVLRYTPQRSRVTRTQRVDRMTVARAVPSKMNAERQSQ